MNKKTFLTIIIVILIITSLSIYSINKPKLTVEQISSIDNMKDKVDLPIERKVAAKTFWTQRLLAIQKIKNETFENNQLF